jgi:cytochrome P450
VDQHELYALDPKGSDLHGEADRLRTGGPAVQVMLPGAIPAWYVTSHPLLKSLLADDRVSKDARRHWPVFQRGEIGQDSWLFMWVGIVNMFTTYGTDHRRLRKLVAPASRWICAAPSRISCRCASSAGSSGSRTSSRTVRQR